jgi:hypothetical protein
LIRKRSLPNGGIRKKMWGSKKKQKKNFNSVGYEHEKPKRTKRMQGGYRERGVRVCVCTCVCARVCACVSQRWGACRRTGEPAGSVRR